MGSIAESAVRPVTSPGPGQPPGFPFRGPGLLARVVPFAVVAVLAEVSLALPPGVISQPAMIASIVLLLAAAALFALPWRRLPTWATVLVPLAYTGSVLALILAAGATSGVGIVILVRWYGRRCFTGAGSLPASSWRSWPWRWSSRWSRWRPPTR